MNAAAAEYDLEMHRVLRELASHGCAHGLGVESLVLAFAQDGWIERPRYGPGFATRAWCLTEPGRALLAAWDLEQRAMFAASIATATRGGVGGQSRNSEIDAVTIREAAERLHAHPAQVSQAKRLQRTAAPEVVDAVRPFARRDREPPF